MGAFEYIENEAVKLIEVPFYQHTEAGLPLKLKDMSIYLLNEDDFGIQPAEFDPAKHEHSIPKFEMARVFLLVCAATGDKLGFTEDDRSDAVYAIYEKAWQRCLAIESAPELLLGLTKIGKDCGFRQIIH